MGILYKNICISVHDSFTSTPRLRHLLACASLRPRATVRGAVQGSLLVLHVNYVVSCRRQMQIAIDDAHALITEMHPMRNHLIPSAQTGNHKIADPLLYIYHTCASLTVAMNIAASSIDQLIESRSLDPLPTSRSS